MLEAECDLILFQELPGVVPYVETHDMVKANPRTHSGNLATLVGNHLVDEEMVVTTVPGTAVLLTLVERDLTIANVHLAPGPGAGHYRLEQLTEIIAESPTSDLVVAGDTNTRVAEETDIASLGLTGRRPPSPTWDGRRNRFRADGAQFSAYFTRCFATEGVAVDNQRVIPGSRHLDGARFHLSDHFALAFDVLND